MPHRLRDRVAARLQALGITAVDASRRGGLDRCFVRDILSERKQSAHGANLAKLAIGLGCSVAYLTGGEDDPGEPPNLTAAAPFLPSMIPFRGVVEQGALRQTRPPDQVAPQLVRIAPSGKFSKAAQWAALLRGEAPGAPSLSDGAYLVCVDLADYRQHYGGLRDRMLVVAQTEAPGGLTARELYWTIVGEHGIFLASEPDGPPVPNTPAGLEIEAVVAKAEHHFA